MLLGLIGPAAYTWLPIMRSALYYTLLPIVY